MNRVAAAFGRGVASQLTPRMLALLVVPFAVAVLFWILSAWFLWEPVTGWFHAVVFQGDGWMARGYRWVAQYGLGGLGTWIPNLFALLLLELRGVLRASVGLRRAQIAGHAGALVLLAALQILAWQAHGAAR